MNKAIILKRRPFGKPTLDDFKFVQEEMPSPKEGEILLKAIYVSVDPYLRGRMNNTKSYVPPFELNAPLQSGIIAQVVVSKHAKFETNDFLTGILDWKEYQTSNGQDLYKVDENAFHLSAYLGVLGMTGLTAYFGLTEIGRPKKGETLFISGAGGAVGTIVGQIGKLMGC